MSRITIHIIIHAALGDIAETRHKCRGTCSAPAVSDIHLGSAIHIVALDRPEKSERRTCFYSNCYYIRTLKNRAGRSAARLARMLREHEVPGSNPGAPTLVFLFLKNH